MKRRLGYKKAVEVGEHLKNSSYVDMVSISQEIMDAGWKMFLKYDDKGFSFTDCINFIVMQKMRIKDALTLDVHFKQMGFNVVP